MSGFKPFADDWPRNADEQREMENHRVPDVKTWNELDESGRPKSWPKPQPKEAFESPRWIATEGRGMSGHDFGCEWVWLIWSGCCPLRREDLSPSYFVVSRHGEQYLILLQISIGTEEWTWNYVTHYMVTDIRTPEPPAEPPE